MANKNYQNQQNVAYQYYLEGYKIVENHPVFVHLLDKASVIRDKNKYLPEDGLAVVYQDGRIFVNPTKREDPKIWARVIAHCLLHLGMEHFVEKENQIYWNVACDLVVEKFLSELKFGKTFYENSLPSGINDEFKLYNKFIEGGFSEDYLEYSTTNDKTHDMVITGNSEGRRYYHNLTLSWPAAFAAGLSLAVKSAIDVAAGEIDYINYDKKNILLSNAEKAKKWFISSYPLLGAIATNFKIIEDQIICHRMQISVAAISCYMQEIYINPLANLTYEECKFVMAHEFLHAALCHDSRKEWRDAYLWNVACDYVINMWLTEMGVGDRPSGLLYDEKLKGMNAEGVYDLIRTDMRKYRKLATLRGEGLGDILPENEKWWTRGDGIDLDSFYRSAIEQGLNYHHNTDRGSIPEGLIEDIRALNHPPIKWDVELARWFDEMFVPLEKKRSYARPSRRQSATPDIPRASYIITDEMRSGRTFGVVLDTSGSMDRSLLAVCLGAIASYSVSKDVTATRVVFCDAAAYDQGYINPEDIAGTVKVRGRGGTVLQPAIDLLNQALDFPKDAPILLITDGYCEERLSFGSREHAFLIPQGNNLPFIPKGKVFRIKD